MECSGIPPPEPFTAHVAVGKGHGMDFIDKTLKCVDCGNDFVFTAGEQLFFHDKQFKNEPKRCKTCKSKRASGKTARPETRTTCSECGAETTVPFKPSQGRPVLCRSCFQRKQPGAQAGSAARH
jgi:CxxC-x17-CxxC domain-containing protein